MITLLEAWVQASSPERVLPGLADYLTSPKAAMAEGKVSRSFPLALDLYQDSYIS